MVLAVVQALSKVKHFQLIFFFHLKTHSKFSMASFCCISLLVGVLIIIFFLNQVK